MRRLTLRSSVSAALVAVLIAAPPAQGQTAAGPRGTPGPISIPIGLYAGLPQGEFAQNVALAGGIGGGILWNVGGPVALRADLNVMLYDSETRRAPLGVAPWG